ncbi:MAG TPA: PHP domain-containing protein, partial [Alphaproteobacteria bacterium]|nr:PHP domain-containing protein [Alphaproteobacteria bacterium]
MSYAELQVTSNFSFLRGASRPGELVATAAILGHAAIAITDRNSLAGVVRAHAAARIVNERRQEQSLPPIRLVVGARLDFVDAPSVLCFPTDRAAYGRLCRLLTRGKGRARKGKCTLYLADLFDYGDGQRIVALPVDRPDEAFAGHLRRLHDRFGRAAYLAIHHLYRGDDARRLVRFGDLAGHVGLPLVATNDVHAHVPDRRPLQDVLTCIREGCTVHDAGLRLFANAERHLKSPEEMARLFRHRPDAIGRTLEIAEACTFSLDELKYEYPVEPVPEGRTPQEELERLVRKAAGERWSGGIPEKIRKTIDDELALIGRKNYAPYFLTVHDIVRHAKEKLEILCQGRGSAANSVVCYVLGITAVDPTKVDLLFERFVSADRNEPPDIDVDFEHERREEVIQYVYDKYGRDRAALAATVISYRPKSAIRDVGKALGLSLDAVGALSKSISGWGRDALDEIYIREAGLDPDEPTLKRAIALARELIGFPRHLSQHVGGFVITKGPLCEAVPIENAAMEKRTVIEWDKDDLDAIGMLKIDVLALGMLTCLRKGFDLIQRHHGRRYKLHTVPQDQEAVYEMLSCADTVGVFQVES